MTIRDINDDAQFQTELESAGGRLVVADFSATWCAPCRRIAPQFAQLPSKYPVARFLKIDVDKCQDTAAGQDVSAMPTFVFYRNQAKVGAVRGADMAAVEAKIVELIGTSGLEGEEIPPEEDYGQGMIDLRKYILEQQCECLNECDVNCMKNCLSSSDSTYLQSGCDPQLIISVTFLQSVKIHSLKVRAPSDTCPKELKIFINQPRTIDFDMAEQMTSVQDLTLDPTAVEKGEPLPLRFVKFQNVNNIQIYVRNNQKGGDITQIEYLGFIGSPVQTTNMNQFKRVAGEVGERD